jgi:hypothetical protein
MHENIFESSLKQIPILKIKGICLIFLICPTSFINISYWTIVLNPYLTYVGLGFPNKLRMFLLSPWGKNIVKRNH